jgi:pSer/pThr/pTyr-binding forkhead associated (FHA) protein
MGSLIVTSGKQNGEYLPLGKRTSVIGRDEAISLQVLDSLVSRKHLRIWWDKETGRYYADDMHSKHGVFINGGKIIESTALTDGDEIMVGDTMLMYSDKEFEDRKSALEFYKERGQRELRTKGDSIYS